MGPSPISLSNAPHTSLCSARRCGQIQDGAETARPHPKQATYDYSQVTVGLVSRTRLKKKIEARLTDTSQYNSGFREGGTVVINHQAGWCDYSYHIFGRARNSTQQGKSFQYVCYRKEKELILQITKEMVQDRCSTHGRRSLHVPWPSPC